MLTVPAKAASLNLRGVMHVGAWTVFNPLFISKNLNSELRVSRLKLANAVFTITLSLASF